MAYYAYALFVARHVGAFALPDKVRHDLEMVQKCKEELHMMIMLEDMCFVCERPTALTVDDQGRLHNETGPALKYADGYAFYAWHGVRIDWEQANIIEKPDSITVKEIEKESNSEVRRVMIERYGTERYIKDSGAKVVHEDQDPQNGDERKLYRKEVPNDEPIVMVAVKNSTPEPDGSIKDYFIRVPPDMETTQQALAWTFGLEPGEYVPQVQT